ncbi:carbohydrate ABC transporter substrate-binding protein, CUT1 family [Sanguibacter gelidistatuariae]|uniref:Carbohydrate ABC transporter substrate-binding protein, CUT1 family n=1 Tax=Sanguibacter gelidistatuariae TaxID=1814289 RepID=A0A1G6WDZ8_9MICO|nr:ABC transporter substrate-binding protein [Sanguibacter gelidistatuariae]SDD63296.1 carbohydrate ABC transporter substrate-binding protein, CUT1 family [Sanguibacter gelidistatuariae]
MRMIRTHAAAVAFAATAALTLSACSSADGGTSAGDGTVSGDITLLSPIFEGSEGQRLLEDELLPQFYAKYPDVKVTVDYTTYNQLNEKLTTAVASGLVPDVMMMGVGWVESFADRGVLANLSETGLTQEKLEESYTKEIVEAGMWEDSVYALPIMLDTRFGVARMDLLREAGYDAPPKTWDELTEMSKALTVRSEDGTLQRTGFDVQSMDPRQMFMTMLFSAGGDLFTEDLTAPAFNSPAGVDALEFVSDLIHVDKVEDIGFSSASADPNPLVNGRAAMAIAHNNVWSQFEKAAPELLGELQPFVIQGEASGMFFGGTLATVSAKSKHPEAAQALMEFLASPGPALAANEQRGNVPALTELLDSDYVQGNPLVQFAMENLDVARREGGPAQWLEIRGTFKPAIEAALLGQQTPQEALDGLAKSAQTAIDRK